MKANDCNETDVPITKSDHIYWNNEKKKKKKKRKVAANIQSTVNITNQTVFTKYCRNS
jgi:hypothetical protein